MRLWEEQAGNHHQLRIMEAMRLRHKQSDSLNQAMEGISNIHGSNRRLLSCLGVIGGTGSLWLPSWEGWDMESTLLQRLASSDCIRDRTN